MAKTALHIVREKKPVLTLNQQLRAEFIALRDRIDQALRKLDSPEEVPPEAA